MRVSDLGLVACPNSCFLFCLENFLSFLLLTQFTHPPLRLSGRYPGQVTVFYCGCAIAQGHWRAEVGTQKWEIFCPIKDRGGISLSYEVYLKVGLHLYPFRESERFQSWLFLLYGNISAFKVRSRCFLNSQGFIGLVHTFGRQAIAGLIYTVLFH